jgi:hypothetical protein
MCRRSEKYAGPKKQWYYDPRETDEQVLDYYEYVECLWCYESWDGVQEEEDLCWKEWRSK